MWISVAGEGCGLVLWMRVTGECYGSVWSFKSCGLQVVWPVSVVGSVVVEWCKKSQAGFSFFRSNFPK